SSPSLKTGVLYGPNSRRKRLSSVTGTPRQERTSGSAAGVCRIQCPKCCRHGKSGQGDCRTVLSRPRRAPVVLCRLPVAFTLASGRSRARSPRRRTTVKRQQSALLCLPVLSLAAGRTAPAAPGRAERRKQLPPALTLAGHAFTVYSIAFSPRGRLPQRARKGN